MTFLPKIGELLFGKDENERHAQFSRRNQVLFPEGVNWAKRGSVVRLDCRRGMVQANRRRSALRKIAVTKKRG